jgi:hypothetical protein
VTVRTGWDVRQPFWIGGWIYNDETAAGSRSMDDGVNDFHGRTYGWLGHGAVEFQTLFSSTDTFCSLVLW